MSQPRDGQDEWIPPYSVGSIQTSNIRDRVRPPTLGKSVGFTSLQMGILISSRNTLADNSQNNV